MMDLDHEGHVAVLTLHHGRANAMDLEFCRALAEELDRLSHTPARALVLTATGKIFSAGVDLRRAVDQGADYLGEILVALGLTFNALARFPKPLVAALNGHAIAGGWVLACAADLRLMASGRGRIGIPELQVGVPLPPLACELMREAAGNRFARLMLSGETLGPDEAHALGLVDEVVAPEKLRSRALERAAALARINPEVYALAKRQLREPLFARAREHTKTHGPEIERLWTRQETVDAIRAYVERTLG